MCCHTTWLDSLTANSWHFVTIWWKVNYSCERATLCILPVHFSRLLHIHMSTFKRQIMLFEIVSLYMWHLVMGWFSGLPFSLHNLQSSLHMRGNGRVYPFIHTTPFTQLRPHTTTLQPCACYLHNVAYFVQSLFWCPWYLQFCSTNNTLYCSTVSTVLFSIAAVQLTNLIWQCNQCYWSVMKYNQSCCSVLQWHYLMDLYCSTATATTVLFAIQLIQPPLLSSVCTVYCSRTIPVTHCAPLYNQSC